MNILKPYNYLGLVSLPALAVAGYLMGGWCNFFVPVFCFIIHPTINSLFSSSLPKADSSVQNKYSRVTYRCVALFFVPLVIGLTIWSLYIVGHDPLSLVELTGLVLSVGVINGVLGFTLAHEFIHRFSSIEQIAGYGLLLFNNYMHYGLEHVWGHHVYACTPKDPHTARIGESLYSYLPRAVRATFLNAWEIENKKSFKSSLSSTKRWNRLLFFSFLQLALMLLIIFTAGWKPLLFFLLQNLVAILLLHIVNYLQHYGLVRNQMDDGNFEKMNAHHSWDSAFKDRSLFIFQLENHADHHLHPNRHYEHLSHHIDAPEHPAGYSFMVLLTLVPPLWFRIMNKRIILNK